ncbi:hypothetical protein D5086_025640 [Populus alba]|uniref:Uncharacterized protein n=1 Tax=Populus alba TaxID=43335 RepID=A0ACC4AZQ3_POPAL
MGSNNGCAVYRVRNPSSAYFYALKVITIDPRGGIFPLRDPPRDGVISRPQPPQHCEMPHHIGQQCVKIADFGLGEILSQFLDPKDFVGTIRLVFAICMSAPPCASTEFRDFITRCLQKEPERRWECSAVVTIPFYTAEPGESVKIASKNKNSSNNVLLLFHSVTSIITPATQTPEDGRNTNSHGLLAKLFAQVLAS